MVCRSNYILNHFIWKEGSFYLNKFLMWKLRANMIFGMSWIILMTEKKKVGERGKCTRRKLNWTLLATSPVFFHVNVNGAPYSKGIKSFLKTHFAISKRERLVLHTVQGFLIKLGIKLCLHILEINIFSLSHVILRPTKSMNNLVKDVKIRTFKAIFLIFFCEEYLTRRWTFTNEIFHKLWVLKYFVF